MLYKVMIAEDEPAINDSIRKIIEQLDEKFWVCACVYDGDSVVEYLSREKVDVLFTDIRMPGMDGIQLLEYLNQYYPSVITVVISGYEIFDYVQKAMKYHALDYLLKPFSMNDMKELLEKIRGQLQQREKQYKDKYFHRIFFAGQEDGEKKDQEDAGHKYQMCLLNIGSHKSLPENEAAEEGKYKEIENYLEQHMACRERYKTFCFKSHSDGQYILIGEFEDLAQEYVTAFFKKIYEDLCRNRLPVTMMISETLTDMNQLYSTFRYLRKVMKHKLIFGHSSFGICEKMIPYENTQERLSSTDRFVPDTYKVVKDGDFSKERMIGVLSQCEHARCTQMELESRLKQEFLYVVSGMRERSSFSFEIVEKEILTNLERADTYEQLQEAILDVWNILEEGDGEEEQELIDEVKKYLKNNMKMKLSMKDLSNEFGFVPSYLSMLFREAEGKSPTEYLMQLRIDKAKKLLKYDSISTIQDVAQEVGFQDPLYFSKVFKKATGVTPSKFRAE